MPAATVDIVIREQGAERVQRSVRGIQGSLTRMGAAITKYAGAGLAVAGASAAYMFVKAAKSAMDFDRALTKAAIQGHATAAGQAAMKRSILESSAATGIAKENLVEYVSSVTDATGDIKFAVDTLDLVSKASLATGADLQGLGQMTSDMGMKFNLSGKEIGDALAVMIVQGEKGRLTLEEMAQVAPEAMSVAGLAGMQGIEGLREMGSYLQIVRQGYGSAEQAATGFKTMVAQIYSAQSKGKLKALGIKIEDPKTGKLRTFSDIFLDVIEKTKGSAPALMDIFGTHGILGATQFAKVYKDAGGSIEAVRKELDKYAKVNATTQDIEKKFGRAQDGASVKIDRLKSRLDKLFIETADGIDAFNLIGEAAESLATSIEGLVSGIDFAAKYYAETFGPTEPVASAEESAKLTEPERKARQVVGALSLADPYATGLAGGYTPPPEFEKWFKGSQYYTPGLGTVAQQATAAVGTSNDPHANKIMADAMASAFGQYLATQKIDVAVTVNNADGATVEVKGPSGKLKPGKGASAQ